jgi:hypothetical protein
MPTSAATTTPPNERQGDWSPVVDGLRGRLIAISSEDGGRPQVRLDLELANDRPVINPLPIWWAGLTGMLALTLDENGTEIQRIEGGGNEMIPPPYWLELPHKSTLRMTITPQGFEYLADGRVLFRPTTFQEWALHSLPQSGLYLSGRFTPTTAPEPAITTPRPTTMGQALREAVPDRPFRSQLVLPRVQLR